MPRVGDANFPFKIVATDVENNVLEFEAPLVFVERDHNVVDGKLEAARDTYNAHALVDREFDLKGQKVAYADSVKPDDTMLSTSSLTFNVAIPIGIGGSQDEPRFVPVLDEAQVVVPAMSALTGDAAPQRVKYQEHYAKQGFASNAVEAFLEFPTPPGMKFAGKGDRSGGFVTPSLNVKALSPRHRSDLGRRRQGRERRRRLQRGQVLRGHQRQAVRSHRAADAAASGRLRPRPSSRSS